MADFILNNIFRISVCTINFVSPSIVADILLHPFDFATVLLQIGFNPEGNKCENSTLVSVLLQYAIFTFYIPYLLTSMQGLQFMGMPHPSIFYYVNFIYRKEGFRGCYRGLVPKICERLIMVSVNERVRRSINNDSAENSTDYPQDAYDDDSLLQKIINGACSQFFAILASHPFHVIMVSSFAEFTRNKKSSILELSHSIYRDDGYFGFFTGLTARLLGEILSLIFSVIYTNIINKQTRPHESVAENQTVHAVNKTANQVVNYFSDLSRFTAFKPKPVEGAELEDQRNEQELEPNSSATQQCFSELVFKFLRNLTQNSSPQAVDFRSGQNSRGTSTFLSYMPFTSKLFYYIMIRDFLSKKISNPFYLVCHCAIVLDSGWSNFPLLTHLKSLGVRDFMRTHLSPSRKSRKERRQRSKRFKFFVDRTMCIINVKHGPTKKLKKIPVKLKEFKDENVTSIRMWAEEFVKCQMDFTLEKYLLGRYLRVV